MLNFKPTLAMAFMAMSLNAMAIADENNADNPPTPTPAPTEKASDQTIKASQYDNAQSCKDGLTDNGRLIYDKAQPKIKADSDLRKVITKAARGLVFSGKMKRKETMASGPAAGECLYLYKQDMKPEA